MSETPLKDDKLKTQFVKGTLVICYLQHQPKQSNDC